jgi:hypothetical protein
MGGTIRTVAQRAREPARNPLQLRKHAVIPRITKTRKLARKKLLEVHRYSLLVRRGRPDIPLTDA